MSVTFEQAIEVFVRGFCIVRSFTHPYRAERVDGLWMMRDAPRRSGNARVEEFVAHAVAPERCDEIVRQHARGHYRICVIRKEGESDSSIRAGFRALKYRLMATESFMAHALRSIPAAETGYQVVRVGTPEQARILHAVTRVRQVLPQHLTEMPPTIRQYMALDGEKPVGWAKSIAAGNATWCSNVFVEPTYRRQGIGRAIMTRLLRDDRESGAAASVLLASHAGAMLYPAVGYEPLGELLMFTPPRKRVSG